MPSYVPKCVKKTCKARKSGRKSTRKTMRRPNPSLVKALKAIVNRQAETKHTPVNETEYVMATTNSSFFPSINLSSWLALDQGTGDGQRVGNKVNVTKATLNMIVRRNNTTSSLYPCELHVFIGHLRQNRNENPDPFLSSFYQDGPSVLPWNGSMLRTLRKPNTDVFTISKKMVFKIGPAVSTGGQFSNNDFPVLHRRKVSLKKLMGKITYGDDGTASNFDKDLWMWASYVYLDDSIDNLAVSPGLKPVDLLYFMDYEYKDF